MENTGDETTYIPLTHDDNGPPPVDNKAGDSAPDNGVNDAGGLKVAKGSNTEVNWIDPTPFAPVYRSIFIAKEPVKKHVTPLLRHVNCGYLSTRGIAPTLLQLKQHAQALTILIKSLTVSSQPAIIDNANSGITGVNPFNDGETYDFLNNLREVYTGPKNPALLASHNRPLNAVLNVLQQDIQPGYKIAVEHGIFRHVPDMAVMEDICPLHYSETTPVGGPAMPYATHEALISHANEILEMLDHEYSATGGLLSILPSKDDTESRAKAEATLLGQFILYVQRLVQRLHDLERLYANSMDALAGEAVVPHQALSALGPDGRKGRELVYPQDRFVLVNAGEDVWQFLNREFEHKEAVDAKVAESYNSHGIAGEALWAQRGGVEFSRGICALDITTRYYRLREDPLKTIFVIPAHGEHPAMKVTREMEKQPTVVAVVKPVWPERVSEWEMKHRKELDEGKRVKLLYERNMDELQTRQREVKFLTSDNEAQAAKIRLLQRDVVELNSLLEQDPNPAKLEMMTAMHKDGAEKTEALRFQAELKEKEKADGAERVLIQAERDQLSADQAAWATHKIALDKANTDTTASRVKQLADMDADLARGTNELAKGLEVVWREQIHKTQELVNQLKRKALAVEMDAEMIKETQAHADLTSKEVDSLLDKARQDALEVVRKAKEDDAARVAAAAAAAAKDTDMGGT